MPQYSHSKLSAYESCPLKYRYAYVDRVQLEERPENIEAFMGKRVHETLVKLYSDRIIAKHDTVDDLLDYYDDIWGKRWSDDVTIVRKEYTAEHYHATGGKCIADYYARYQPFDESRTLGLEQNVVINVNGYRLTGYIDRLSRRNDGCYEIHDYKTSKSLPPQSFFDRDRQLTLYMIGVRDSKKDAGQVDLVWHFLIHDKEIRSQRTEYNIERLKEYVVSLIGRIEQSEKENDFPAVKGELCKWCEYRSLCAAINGTHATRRNVHDI